MKKNIIRITVEISLLIIIFISAMYIISNVINKDSIEMTMEMSPASFPLVSVQYGGYEINEMHGYADVLDTDLLRENITPLSAGRKLNLLIDTFGNDLMGLSYEVRSVDGSRLIEKTDIAEYEQNGTKIALGITLKDLIESNQEYVFVLLAETSEQGTIYYYTRIMQEVDYHVQEKIEYVLDFHQKTFDKEAAQDIVKYLESNSDGDNSTFSKVNIHSSFKQVTWGDLNVQKITDGTILIKEIQEQTASFTLNYQAAITEEGEQTIYRVEEYYRIRYTPDRMYLLDYERTMEQFFDKDRNAIAENRITLGIVNEDVQLTESDSGNAFAFEVGNALYGYDITNNKMALIFSFYNSQNSDIRNTYEGHQIKVLNVDEGGNVTFLVYGYMNRGRHEGHVGVSVYYYNSVLNTIEEMVYLPYYKSAQVLRAEVDRMAYVNKTGILYLMLGQDLYAIHLESRTHQIIVSGLSEGSYQVSDSNKMVVWQNTQEEGKATKLLLMNLSTGKQKEIKAGYEEYIKPLGFMGEDLIYGLVKMSDAETVQGGKRIFPMYCVKIENEVEGVLKEEQEEDIYITDCRIEKNQITLHRIRRVGEGLYETAPEGYITSVESLSIGRNYMEKAATQKYANLIQIVAKNSINKDTLKFLTPKEVLFEGMREIDIEKHENQIKHYYVYGKNGVSGIFTKESNAVELAYEISGVVIDDSGEYVWYKGNRSIKNQIMAIKGEMITENKDSLVICLETMLSYNGVIRNAEYLLRQGKTILNILEEGMPDAQILDLTGCSLDAVLYYVNKDIPVLVTLRDGSAMLLIGYNELNTVVMDPQTGTVYKMGMNDSKELFEENGNYFITYY